MIILQANKFFYEKGGSERYLFALSHALLSRGHEVVHFAMEHPSNLSSPYRRHFAPRRDYDSNTPSAGSLGAVLEFVRSPGAARRLSGLLDEVKPDVAHLHNIYHQLTPSIIDVLARRGVPIVMTLHDYKLVCPSYAMFARGAYCYRCRGGRFHHAVTVNCAASRSRSALLAFEAYWQRWTGIYNRVDCFIAPSEYLRGVMTEAGMASERIVFVPPLNPSSVKPAPGQPDAAIAPPELPEQFIAYVGRLSAEKGIHVLLGAMARVKEIPLVVFGDGPEREALGDTVKRNRLDVVFAGHVSRPVMDASLRRAGAMVLPTLSPENAPMAILEAADAGVPVIVSDRGGLPELAARVGGQVVAAGDEAALALAIGNVWADPERWRERARAAWQRSRPEHGADAHVQSIEAVYRRAIERRKAAA